jgi:uncharacterized protein
MSEPALPLFPLNTVLFPGGPLSLRIFEPRYLDMVRRCGREQSAFGVVLIIAGAEAGEVAAVADTGTTARLVDFTTRSDGLLGIDCVGEQRFRLLRRWQQPDGLNLAEVEYLPAEPPCALPTAFEHLARLLRELLPRLGDAYARIPGHYQDAGWVGNRWAELLPVTAAEKQRLLELTDPTERLAQVAAWSARQSATAYV